MKLFSSELHPKPGGLANASQARCRLLTAGLIPSIPTHGDSQRISGRRKIHQTIGWVPAGFPPYRVKLSCLRFFVSVRAWAFRQNPLGKGLRPGDGGQIRRHGIDPAYTLRRALRPAVAVAADPGGVVVFNTGVRQAQKIVLGVVWPNFSS